MLAACGGASAPPRLLRTKQKNLRPLGSRKSKACAHASRAAHARTIRRASASRANASTSFCSTAAKTTARNVWWAPSRAKKFRNACTVTAMRWRAHFATHIPECSAPATARISSHALILPTKAPSSIAQKIGANCAENKLEGGLVVRGCSSPTLCFPGAPETRCTGDREVVSCRDGIVDKMICGANERCVTHHDPEGEQVASCAEANEKRCTDVGEAACDGDHLVECVSDGHFGRVRTTDCAAHGLACGAQGRAAACVAASPSECAPFPPKCDGGFLVYCAEGVVAKVACAEIGLGVCDPSAHGPKPRVVRAREIYNLLRWRRDALKHRF